RRGPRAIDRLARSRGGKPDEIPRDPFQGFDPMNATSTDDNKVIVIGAGLGGLAATCTLAARGYDVTLVEANDWLGGKAAVHEQDGFRFAMGPTILTVPRVLKRIFSEAGREMGDYLDLVPLDPQWRCFFDDGSVLDLVADVSKM